jgi:hypothetical protein
MFLAAIDNVLSQQALITGQVRDGLTGGALLYAPVVTLHYQAAAGEPERPYPLAARIYPGGRFVFASAPATTFPRISTRATLDLLLRASAARYQTEEVPFSLSAAALTPAGVIREIDGRDLMLLLLEAPLLDQTIALQPQPLHLNGRVVDADSPDEPIANASVTILEPVPVGPLQTGTNGYFTFYDLPVATTIRLQVEQTGFVTLDTVVTLDYRQPVNQMTFALTPS